MTALAMSSALRHCKTAKGLWVKGHHPKPPPLLPIHDEVRQCHWARPQGASEQEIPNPLKISQRMCLVLVILGLL